MARRHTISEPLADPGSSTPQRVIRTTSRLLEVLERQGLITSEAVEEVSREQARTGRSLPLLVLERNLVTEDQLLECLAQRYGLPIIDVSRLSLAPELTRLLKRELVEKHLVLPIRQIGRRLLLAISDPTVPAALDDVAFATGLEVHPVLTSPAIISRAIERRYGDQSYFSRLDQLLKSESASARVEVVERTTLTPDVTHLSEEANAAPIIRFVNLILADAIRRSASDIHLEPYEDRFRVRYRIDGVLTEVMAVPKSMEAATLSRLKIMSNLDIAERRLPQDGRISVKAAGSDIEVRVSSAPTIYGEKLVLRILDKSGVVLDLARLGFEPDDLERFSAVVAQPYGMILVAGPTGSGKSTTLYAALATLDAVALNVMTAEDPVEYHLNGVNQVQVREEIGLGFDATLRSFLRQDPDVILIGEMRDTETMTTALRAALTGHLVLSTLHTNDAPSTVTRLVDMGAAPYLVASSLLLVVAQRLVRQLCPECRYPVTAPAHRLLDLGVKPEDLESLTLYRGRGCVNCNNTGYRGRTAIHELLVINEEMQEAIGQSCSASELRQIAVKQGMRTLRQAGLLKAGRGQTTLEEIVRVTAGHEARSRPTRAPAARQRADGREPLDTHGRQIVEQRTGSLPPGPSR
jgi:type IV pilus assembly protein PilB